jgi:hypothetical protein
MLCFSWTNNNHPPRIGCLLAEKRVVALHVNWRRWGSMYQKYNETHNLPPGTDADDLVVMEELRLWRRRQICNNDCFGCENNKQPLLKLVDSVFPCHVSSRRCEIITQQFWGYERVEHQETKEQNGMSMGVVRSLFLWREARFYAEMCKWIGTTHVCVGQCIIRNNRRKDNHYRQITSRRSNKIN